tara:strand:- start:4111 stop:4296 length:186 start_codon:yes stop_codon:yes gene_type:complete
MIKITIDTDNAAFEPHFHSRVGSILDKAARVIRKVDRGELVVYKLRDANGSTCGTVELSEK